MSSTRPGNQERGWNDPPEFLHNSTESTNLVTNQRTILNKRVAHNLGAVSSGGEATQRPGGGIPTPIQIPTGGASATPAFFGTTPPRTPTLTSAVAAANGNMEAAQEMTIEEIEQEFNEKLNHLKGNGISAKVIDDIAKRVKVFVGNWEKLSNAVKVKMSELATALKSGDFSKADDIHVRLVMDYSSEVIQWMVGVKKLIYELKNPQQ